MLYQRLGKSGLVVSKLCLGTMTFGNELNEHDSIEMIERFMERGGNFIDTANVYVAGESEKIVGKAIREHRSEVVLATKVRMRTSQDVNGAGLSRKHIMEQVEHSLRRLQTDYIDLYQAHVWDELTPIEETLRAFEDLITQGKVRYIGCSNFLAWQMMKAVCYSEFYRYPRLISVQPEYSLINREMDREVMPLCRAEDIGVIPWAPLGSGFLTGKYKRGSKPQYGRLGRAKGEASWENRNTERNFNILDELLSVSAELGKTAGQTALNWLMHKPGVTSPIFGATSLEQFEENIDVFDWQLDQKQWDQLDQISRLPEEYPTRFIEKFKRVL